MDAKVPTKPPFTAHISNLPRDVEVEDVLQVFKKVSWCKGIGNFTNFAQIQVKAVRLCKPRGCLRSGFMEFENREQLITALCMNMRLVGVT
jgi:hypothetical protein